MSEKTVTELRERFARDGYVEFRLSPAKLALHVLFVLGITGIIVVWGMSTGVAMGIALGLLAVLFILIMASWLGELVFGSGPALRVDQDGLTFRQWKRPLCVSWADVVAVISIRMSKSAPQLWFLLTASAWEQRLEARSPLLRRFERLAHFGAPPHGLHPGRTLDVGSTAILAWLDGPTLDSLTTRVEARNLVLAPGAAGHGPLFFRNGREPQVDSLPLSDAIRTALQEWNAKATAWLTEFNEVAEAERGKPSEETSRSIDAHAAEGRTLATHVQSELGLGTEVTLWLDSPDF